MSGIPGSAHLNFSLGGLAVVGGAVGFLKKGSKASLLAGATFGGLLLASGALIVKDQHYEGHTLAAATGGLMALGMGHRFIQTAKFMPAGSVASLGAIACAYNVKKALEWAPAKED